MCTNAVGSQRFGPDEVSAGLHDGGPDRSCPSVQAMRPGKLARHPRLGPTGSLGSRRAQATGEQRVVIV